MSTVHSNVPPRAAWFFLPPLVVAQFAAWLPAQATWTRLPDPSARIRPLLAFDAARAKVVLYGGRNTQPLTDTWTYDGQQWELVPTAQPLFLQVQAGMAFDTRRNLMVLVGATSLGGATQTWEFDGRVWAQRITATSPAVLLGGANDSALAYDARRGVSVLVMAESSGPATWEFDGVDWRRAVNPPGTTAIGPIAYDDARGRCVAWTRLPQGPSCLEWDGTTWVTHPAASLPPLSHALTYDSRSRRVIAFGADRDRHLYSWSGTGWEIQYANAAPASRQLPGLVVDPVRQMIVFVGGYDETSIMGDIWTLRGEHQWSQTTLGAPYRQVPAVAWDGARGRLVLFGGFLRVPKRELFEWDGTRWADLTPAHGPSARLAAATIYDPASRRTVLFGGRDSAMNFGDTWEWDGLAWTQRFPSTSPSPRYSAHVAYDSRRERVMLSGGSGQVLLTDTWEWDGQNWRRLPDVPDRSFQAGLAYDSRRDRLVLAVGYRVGPIGLDTRIWEWDGAVWHATNPPLSPREGTLVYDEARARTVLLGNSTTETWEWDGALWVRTVAGGGSTYYPPPNFGQYVYDSSAERVLACGSSGVHIDAYASVRPASYRPFGSGCGNAAGAPVLTATTRPWLGDQLVISVSGLPIGSSATLLTGASDQQFLGMTLPLRLEPYGFPGCTLWTSAEVWTPLVGNGSSLEARLPLPTDAALAGARVYQQALALNAQGALASSNGGAAILGLR